MCVCVCVCVLCMPSQCMLRRRTESQVSPPPFLADPVSICIDAKQNLQPGRKRVPLGPLSGRFQNGPQNKKLDNLEKNPEAQRRCWVGKLKT